MSALSHGTSAGSICLAAGIIAGCGGTTAVVTPPAMSYAIDDGTAERAIGIDPGEDALWFNTFPVQAGGEIIHSIGVSFGRPGLSQSLDGLPIKILLYEQADGGSPWTAVLKQSVNATTANANTNTINVYEVPPTEIHGTLLAGVLFRNTGAVNDSISSFDLGTPTLPARSYYAFATDLNEADLTTLPADQFGTIESFGQVGNWVLRAGGTPRP